MNDNIDKNIDMLLKAAGSAFKHYTMQKSLDDMRDVMRDIMSKSYIQGSNDCYDTLLNQRKEKNNA